MRISLVILAAVLVSSIVLAAQRTSDALVHDAYWSAPLAEAAKANPLAQQLEAADGGKKIFAQRCSTCHGENAEGTPDAPSLTGSAVRRQTDGALFWKISSGNTRRGMPTFSFLPPPQRWQLVLFIRQAGAVETRAADR